MEQSNAAIPTNKVHNIWQNQDLVATPTETLLQTRLL